MSAMTGSFLASRAAIITPFSQQQRRNTILCRAQSTSPSSPSGAAPEFDRRSALLSLAAAAAAVTSTQLSIAAAAEEEYEVFFGAASPPTSYGGYGGNAKEDAKYTFEYPVGWKSAAPNKVEKGTQGIDCRVFNPKNRSQQITVVTFGRAGEDNKSFRLTDIDTTIAGFAGADYDLQDALSSATDKINSEREIDGQRYYSIQIDSPDVQYLATFTVNMGKVFALFVKCPTRSFKASEEALRHVQDTFHTL